MIEFEVDIDKLNTVRRKMSFDDNHDFTQDEIIKKLIDKAFAKAIDNRQKNVVMSDDKSKLQKIRRYLSNEYNKDLTLSETVCSLVEQAYLETQSNKHRLRKVSPQLIYEELSKGYKIDECAKNLGVSRMTICRAKAKLRELNM